MSAGKSKKHKWAMDFTRYCGKLGLLFTIVCKKCREQIHSCTYLPLFAFLSNDIKKKVAVGQLSPNLTMFKDF